VRSRLGRGVVLDVGCGLGFESAGFLGPGRVVVGLDYDPETTETARRDFGGEGLRVACMDATRLGLRRGGADFACSSHLIEHFWDPAEHVTEVSRTLNDGGTAFFLTPNRPADFENPFHLVLFERDDLAELLTAHFGEVWVGGLDATPQVKADLAARRAKAERLLRLDVLDLRHRLPRSWYVTAYTRLLPIAYRLLARGDSGGSTGISADDFFVTEDVDVTTPVLFAIGRKPRRAA
jgi:SAM-dependent methyltransferase